MKASSHAQNRLATECFRNVADRQYISARMGFRLGLVDSYLWSAIRTIEKYLRAILIYNGRSEKNLSHNLLNILGQVEGIGEIHFTAARRERQFIEHLNGYCEGRHLDRKSYRLSRIPAELDHTVWSVRRYCMYLGGTHVGRDGQVTDLFAVNLKNIKSEYYMQHPADFKIAGGFLEEVLQRERTDKMRQSLVWKNAFYGDGKERDRRKLLSLSRSGKLPRAGRQKGRSW